MLAKLIEDLRLRRRRRKYRVGVQLSHFVARDVRRDIQVLDASEVDRGFITIASRTWDLLYASRRHAPEPEFGSPTRVAIKDLWKWPGPAWGRPVPDHQEEAEA